MIDHLPREAKETLQLGKDVVQCFVVRRRIE